MKTYEVTNPFLAFCLPETGRDCTLQRGDAVQLPETSPAVRAMLACGLIREIPGEVPAPAPKKTK